MCLPKISKKLFGEQSLLVINLAGRTLKPFWILNVLFHLLRCNKEEMSRQPMEGRTK
jgi:hypothetical protein